MPSNRAATFDAGQSEDCKVVDYVYRLVERRFTGAKIVVVASCLGALRIVNWLASTRAPPQSLAALALESPLPSLSQYSLFLANSKRSRALLYGLMVVGLPNFRGALDPMYVDAKRPLVNPDVPVLVSVLASDPCSNLETLQPLLQTLPDAHILISRRVQVNNGALGRVYQMRHGRLVFAPEQQHALRTLVAEIVAKPSKIHKKTTQYLPLYHAR
jgi:hypothetical protein